MSSQKSENRIGVHCPKFDDDAKDTLEIRVERKRHLKLGELGEVSFSFDRLARWNTVKIPTRCTRWLFLCAPIRGKHQYFSSIYCSPASFGKNQN